ncbi:MAG: ATP-grasp domain-containing protein [Acidobacteriota bacterium]|nr:ATP-grasp domain-containing protein [Acidobacteriota bacterium]
MPMVVFVAPFFMQATLRFLDAVASLPGVRVCLVSQEAPEKLPAGVRDKLSDYRHVADAVDPVPIAGAVNDLAGRHGSAHRLLGVLEQLQVPLAVVRERLGIEGLRVEAAENFRDKSRMKTVLRDAGVPCARHHLAADAREALEFAGRIGFPLVVKPPAGAGARDTFRVNDEAMLRQALAAAPPAPGRPVLLEEFITGEEHSFDTVSIRGRHEWHSVSRYYPTPLEVMENPWIQWCVLLPRKIDDPSFDEIRKVAGRALDALGMVTGLSHMEWFRRENGTIAISEVGARPPGAQFVTLMSYAHDMNFYKAWAELMVFESFEPPERRYSVGAAFLRGQGRGRVKAIRGLDEAQRELGHLVAEVKLPSFGQARASSYEGEGFVILRHPETEVVKQALARVLSLVRVELG